MVVVAGRDASFVLPTPNDLSDYVWAGQVRDSEGELLGEFAFVKSAEQVVVTLPADVTALLPPQSEYEIALGPTAATTSLLAGFVVRESGVVA